MKTVKLFVITLMVLGLASCKKEPVKEPEKKCNRKGKIETAVCGWGAWGNYWIRLDDGTLLQPCKSDISISQNDLYDGREVEIGFEKIDPKEPACQNMMAGCLAWPGEFTSVKITCLSLQGAEEPNEDDPIKCEHVGTLLDNHYGGCNWIIKLNSGEVLSVEDKDINGTSFGHQDLVMVGYTLHKRNTLCNAGLPADIHCIRSANWCGTTGNN